MENALKKIKQLKAQEEVNQKSFLAEEALKYFLYVVNVNFLYDIALGMYSHGLKLYNSKSMEYRQTAVAYASHLSSKAKYWEASVMFTKGKEYAEALNALKKIATLLIVVKNFQRVIFMF